MVKPKDKASLIQSITNRYRVTAREARDIITAVSTTARTVADPNVRNGGVSAVTKKGKIVGSRKTSSEVTAKSGRNIAKQIGEVYTAATTGKSGTKSAKIKSVKNKAGDTVGEQYALETKRKKGSSK
tara:strand:- start:79 stop:459 length:381 start_codon:yes stop_codon:yes gene_type:complete